MQRPTVRIGLGGGYELEEVFGYIQQEVEIPENSAWTTVTLLLVRQVTILMWTILGTSSWAWIFSPLGVLGLIPSLAFHLNKGILFEMIHEGPYRLSGYTQKILSPSAQTPTARWRMDPSRSPPPLHEDI